MSMQDVQHYVRHLESLVTDPQWYAGDGDGDAKIIRALNGELSKTLRKHVPIEALQRAGAFFTSEDMADHLVKSANKIPTVIESVFDPACGGGNLLIAYAKGLPVKGTYEETLDYWSTLIKGFDLHEEFVRATKSRLALLALHRTKHISRVAVSLDRIFPEIRVADSLKEEWPQANLYLINPPYNKTESPVKCSWASGKVSLAALFIEKYFSSNTRGSHLAAILPDVLRSGSQYRAWRTSVARGVSLHELSVLGRFDVKTNVDVFSLVLTNESTSVSSEIDWKIPKSQGKLLKSICSVKVGRVVPHRDAQIGREYVFLDANNTKAWSTMVSHEEKTTRKFTGVTFSPPFVIVRRNSRSGDEHRAVATIVKGHRKVAVENHLIVIEPLDGKIETCIKIYDNLLDIRTTEWLNGRIRCRHLTTGSLENLPLWDEHVNEADA